MPAYSGTAFKCNWLYGSGTLVLEGDYRSFSYTPAGELMDETAGSDANQLFIPGLKSGQAAWAGLLQTGTGAGGTLLTAALAENNFGTLVYSPTGTAAGSLKLTIPAYSGGVQWNEVYNGVFEIACNFTQSGARTDGTN